VTACARGLSTAAALAVLAAAPAAQKQATPLPPAQTFDLTATAKAGPGSAGTVTVPMVLQIDRYTPEHARTTVTDALKYQGYPGFLNALRAAPIVGSLKVGDDNFVVRWAREQPSGAERAISVVTDKPVFFIGIGRPDAKPKAGYEVAVVQFTVDAANQGTGTMAAAARVKPGGPAGFQIDDYAETPVKITVTAHKQE
jgi:hypothetical protein